MTCRGESMSRLWDCPLGSEAVEVVGAFLSAMGSRAEGGHQYHLGVERAGEALSQIEI